MLSDKFLVDFACIDDLKRLIHMFYYIPNIANIKLSRRGVDVGVNASVNLIFVLIERSCGGSLPQVIIKN